MSEPKTALDLANRLVSLCGTVHNVDDIDILVKQLSAIPADAAGQIEKLKEALTKTENEIIFLNSELDVERC